MAARQEKRSGRKRAPPSAASIDAAVESLRGTLAAQPLLMLHDAALPSVTTAIAGEPIAGSWWGHPAGALIFNVLERIDEDVAFPKLVRGKVTLLHRSLWPELIAIGRAEDVWQTRSLPREARELLSRVNEAGSARTDRLREGADGRVIGRAVEQLERRLLVMSAQVHTAEGKHARELSTWQRWQQRVGLAGVQLPALDVAQRRMESLVEGWDQAGGPLLPWSAPG